MQLFIIVSLGIIAVLYPSNENEKPLILLHVLLSFTFFQLLLADAHPTSNNPPLIGLYIVSSMILAAFHLLGACSILRLHRRTEVSHPPRCTRVYIVRPVHKALAGCGALCRKLSCNRNQNVAVTGGTYNHFLLRI